MTLPEVRRLTNHWRRSPPLRTLVAAVAASLGIKLNVEDQEQRRSLYMTAEEAKALLAHTGGKVPGLGSL